MSAKEYAELLHTLVTTSQQVQLKNAADSFVTSLRKVQDVSLSDDKVGAIGLAIQQVGGLNVAKAVTTLAKALDLVAQMIPA
jgi:hypothetical protein